MKVADERDYYLRRDAWPLYLFFGTGFITGVAGVIKSVVVDEPLWMIGGLLVAGTSAWCLYRMTTRLAPPAEGQKPRVDGISRLSWRRARSAVRRDDDVREEDLEVARKYVDRITAPVRLTAPAISVVAGLGLIFLELGRPHPASGGVVLGVVFIALGAWDIWWRLSVGRWARRHGLPRGK